MAFRSIVFSLFLFATPAIAAQKQANPWPAVQTSVLVKVLVNQMDRYLEERPNLVEDSDGDMEYAAIKARNHFDGLLSLMRQKGFVSSFRIAYDNLADNAFDLVVKFRVLRGPEHVLRTHFDLKTETKDNSVGV